MGSLPPHRRLRADRVAIIGAGPSGLAAAKYLVAEGVFSRIVIFEQRSVVGGLWNYDTGDDPHGDLPIPQTDPRAGLSKPVWKCRVGSGAPGNGTEEEATFATPVYERLETNIPRGLMGFSDLQWPEDCQLFPIHEEVLEYIQRYSKEVQHLVAFNTQVLDVRQKDEGGWIVKTQEVERHGRGALREDSFDAVLVANGHFDVPYIPSVVGIEAWNREYPGSISHSKFYRRPEAYAGKKVIVVGNSASGVDISSQIVTTCQPPLLISQKSESFLLSDARDREEKPEIVEYVTENRSVRFADGSAESGVDSILYCTGYFYSFPFLSAVEPPPVTTGERVENTYQHIFYRPDPTLSFLVLNQRVIPFPVAEAQAAVIARVLSGRLSLPTEEDMRLWEKGVGDEAGTARSFHLLKFPKDADYINMLHEWASGATNPSHGRAEDDRHVRGKSPPVWREKEYWIRQRFPSIKKAFQDFGEERHSKRTLEDVGFDFEAWAQEMPWEERRMSSS